MYLTRDFVFPANHVELVQQLLVVAELELRRKLRLMTRDPTWAAAVSVVLCASASIITFCVQNHPLKHAKTQKNPGVEAGVFVADQSVAIRSSST